MKLRINVVDVISRVASLKKAGSRFKGLCPFHQEKTPSFHVDPDKGYYKCFGCGKSGDIFDFVRETEQLSFTESVEALGQRFGVPVEYEEGAGPSQEERSLRQELFEIHDLAADFYHQNLNSKNSTGEFMRAYWNDKRRFTPDIADEFRIGAASPSDDGLAAMLLKRRFSEDAFRQCGLFFIRDEAVLSLGSLKPRFRGRLMIPIRDHQGRIVAFTARQTEITPDDDPAREAKYVNSPETPIFSKGHLLFNLDRARSAVNDTHPFVLVEGQLDAIRCWSVGLKTAVAPQGTSITEQQLILLRRYNQQVECFFDSDSAGQKAALRFLPMALKAGLEARFLTLTGQEKNDPDLLFLQQGLAAYDELRTHALSASAFACRVFMSDPENASPEQKTRAAQGLFEIIAASESETLRAGFVQVIADYLRLPLSAVERDFEVFNRRLARQASPLQRASQAQAKPIDIIKASTLDSPEQHLILLLLHQEGLGKIISQNLPLQWIDTSQVPGRLLQRFLGEIEADNWPGRDHLEGLLEDGDERALVASMLFDSPNFEDPLKIASEGIKLMRSRALEPRLRKIELDLANLKADSDVDAITLIKERSELQRQLRQPIGLPGAV
jgi:DNA primase